MSSKHLDSELNKHLEEVISLRKVSLEDTKQSAMALWDLICSKQNGRVIVQHYLDGKVITTIYTSKNGSGSLSDEKRMDYCADPEFLGILCVIAESSDVRGKCRLCNNGPCRELHLHFK